ncbi:Nif3-like dinuclear metal center hexameric protein, partial [Kocuria sp. ZOR0020]|uniref:Nif3-like dinuclear metal center hexameric protein n=1 Tax=Kocuria sp. ZOR0020 TaxID=1339234 RepID=UPI0006466AFC
MASADTDTQSAPTVAQVVKMADTLWPFSTQESWDASELVIGRPQAPVARIMVAVDPVTSVVHEAMEAEVDLLLVHHPLLLGGQSSIAADGYKGRIVHDLIENHIALLACHTNADSAPSGVSETLIQACGVAQSSPLKPLDSDPATGLGRIGQLETPVTLE